MCEGIYFCLVAAKRLLLCRKTSKKRATSSVAGWEVRGVVHILVRLRYRNDDRQEKCERWRVKTELERQPEQPRLILKNPLPSWIFLWFYFYEVIFDMQAFCSMTKITICLFLVLEVNLLLNTTSTKTVNSVWPCSLFTQRCQAAPQSTVVENKSC